MWKGQIELWKGMDELTTFTLQATQAATYLKYLVRFNICMVVTNNRPYSRYPPSRIGGIKQCHVVFHGTTTEKISQYE